MEDNDDGWMKLLGVVRAKHKQHLGVSMVCGLQHKATQERNNNKNSQFETLVGNKEEKHQ